MKKRIKLFWVFGWFWNIDYSVVASGQNNIQEHKFSLSCMYADWIGMILFVNLAKTLKIGTQKVKKVPLGTRSPKYEPLGTQCSCPNYKFRVNSELLKQLRTSQCGFVVCIFSDRQLDIVRFSMQWNYLPKRSMWMSQNGSFQEKTLGTPLTKFDFPSISWSPANVWKRPKRKGVRSNTLF